MSGLIVANLRIILSVDTITLSYITVLLCYSGLSFLLFYGYSRLNKRHVPVLAGVPGGFITFLATNELLSLPFIIFHLPFGVFYIFFLILNLPVLVFGSVGFASKLRQTKLSFNKTSMLGAVVVSTVVGLMGLTQFYSRYDADDSFYVSTIEQSLNSDSLYSVDPPTGNQNLGFPKIYQFESWELVEASLARSFGLSALQIAHGLVPLLAIALVFLAHKRIFKQILKNPAFVSASLLMLTSLLLFGAYSSHSQGSFLLTRAWQGKALVAALLAPVLLWILAKLYYRPNDNRTYLAIGIINIASLALNPTAIAMNLVAVSTFGLMLVVKTRSSIPTLKLILGLLPILLAGIVAAVGARSDVLPALPGHESTVVTSTYLAHIKAFVGNAYFVYLLPIAWLFLWKIRAPKRLLLLAGPFQLLLFLTFLNPLLFNTVHNHLTNNAYWRLLWLLPVTIILPVSGVYVAKSVADLFKKSSRYKTIAFMASLLILLSLVATDGSYIFRQGRARLAYDNSRSKTPAGVGEVSEFLATQSEGTIIAPALPATYLHNYTPKHQLLISRWLYITRQYPAGSQEYNDLTTLSRIVNSRPHNVSYEEFELLIEKFNVQYIVFAVGDNYLENFAEKSENLIIFSGRLYGVARIGKILTN